MSDVQRVRLLQALLAAAFLVVAAQLVRVQLMQADVLQAAGVGRELRILAVEPPRGRILSLDGEVLADNIARYGVAVVRGDLPEEETLRREALLRVEEETAVPLAEIEEALASPLAAVDPLAPITILDGLAQEEAVRLRAALADVAAVQVRARAMREYGGGDALPHVLGYVGPLNAEDAADYLERGYPLDARVGRGGVEQTYEAELRGVPGRQLVFAHPSGRVLETIAEEPAEPGADLVLSLDLDLQRAALEALADGVRSGLSIVRSEPGREAPVAAGAVVVMDVRTGALRALATYPSYDAALFSGIPDGEALEPVLTDPAHPLVHRGFMEVRSPGSIFKPLVGAAALQEGIATPSTLITSTGALTIRSQYDPSVVYRFGDWMAHGTLDFYGGIARSSDVYFYYLAGGFEDFEGLGPDRIAQYVEAFGLGGETGLDLPGEAEGLVPTPAWKEAEFGEQWLLGDTYTYGIGQGYLTTTPLQMAVGTAALANGGDVLVPRVVEGLSREGRLEPLPREVTRRVPVESQHLEVVREAMRIAADAGGTALTGEPSGLAIGGKTGTAEWGAPYHDGEFDTHGWFAGFAPYDDPEVAVIVYLKYGVGSTHAGPVAREVLEAYFALGEHAAPATATPAGEAD